MYYKHTQAIAKALEMVNEAIRPQDFVKSGNLILQYFKKNGFSTAAKMGGYEPYKTPY